MTHRITIAGIIFNVEPLGYEILKAYQDAWNQWNPHHKRQWEEQTAEHLLQQLSSGESITTLDHIEGIISDDPWIMVSCENAKTS